MNSILFIPIAYIIIGVVIAFFLMFIMPQKYKHKVSELSGEALIPFLAIAIIWPISLIILILQWFGKFRAKSLGKTAWNYRTGKYDFPDWETRSRETD